MTTPRHVNRSLVTLKLPPSAPALINLVRAIVQKMADNPSFPAPEPLATRRSRPALR